MRQVGQTPSEWLLEKFDQKPYWHGGSTLCPRHMLQMFDEVINDNMLASGAKLADWQSDPNPFEENDDELFYSIENDQFWPPSPDYCLMMGYEPVATFDDKAIPRSDTKPERIP